MPSDESTEPCLTFQNHYIPVVSLKVLMLIKTAVILPFESILLNLLFFLGSFLHIYFTVNSDKIMTIVIHPLSYCSTKPYPMLLTSVTYAFICDIFPIIKWDFLVPNYKMGVIGCQSTV